MLSTVFTWLNKVGLGDISGAGDLSSNYKGLALSGDPVVLAVLVVLGLCAVCVAWALLLVVVRGFMGLFGGNERREAPPRHRTDPLMTGMARMAGAPASLRAEARLDSGALPSQRAAAASEPRRSMALLQAPLAPPSDEAPKGSRLAAAVGRPAAPRGFAQEMAALPAPTGPKALPFRQISLSQKPRLAALGQVVAARPEWTGRVTPTSLKEAGAVEECHISTRQDCGQADAEAVREKNFRLFSLPRVDAGGRKQPDLTVFTVSDNGIVPRGMQWPSPKMPKRERD